MFKSKLLTASLTAIAMASSAGIAYAQTTQTPAAGNQP